MVRSRAATTNSASASIGDRRSVRRSSSTSTIQPSTPIQDLAGQSASFRVIVRSLATKDAPDARRRVRQGSRRGRHAGRSLRERCASASGGGGGARRRSARSATRRGGGVGPVCTRSKCRRRWRRRRAETLAERVPRQSWFATTVRRVARPRCARSWLADRHRRAPSSRCEAELILDAIATPGKAWNIDDDDRG